MCSFWILFWHCTLGFLVSTLNNFCKQLNMEIIKNTRPYLLYYHTFPQFSLVQTTAAHDRFCCTAEYQLWSDDPKDNWLTHTHTHAQAHTCTHSLCTWGTVTNSVRMTRGTWGGDWDTRWEQHRRFLKNNSKTIHFSGDELNKHSELIQHAWQVQLHVLPFCVRK